MKTIYNTQVSSEDTIGKYVVKMLKEGKAIELVKGTKDHALRRITQV